MGMATIDDESMEPEVTQASDKPLYHRHEYVRAHYLINTWTKHYFGHAEVRPKPTPKVERKCKADKGERTNRKLKDQPYYHRGRKGKPKGY